MTLAEIQTSTAGLVRMPEVPHTSQVADRREALTVVDCVAYGWRNADDASRCYQQLPEDFVHDYRALLDEAAISLLAPVLTEVWAEHGYTVQFGEETDGEPFRYERPRRPADDVFYAVWDEAAYRLDADQVVTTAGLVGVRATYTDTEN